MWCLYFLAKTILPELTAIGGVSFQVLLRKRRTNNRTQNTLILVSLPRDGRRSGRSGRGGRGGRGGKNYRGNKQRRAATVDVYG